MVMGQIDKAKCRNGMVCIGWCCLFVGKTNATNIKKMKAKRLHYISQYECGGRALTFLLFFEWG